MLSSQRLFAAGLLAAIAVTGMMAGCERSDAVTQEWRYYGGDKSFTRYAPLDQIDAGNVRNLEVVWRRPGLDAMFTRNDPDLRPSNYYKATPILVDGVMYAPNLVGLVEAWDPATGGTTWRQALPSPEEIGGQSSRGVDYWTDGADRRILSVRGTYLYALDAATGTVYPDFGDAGRVDLRFEHRLAGDYSWSSGPVVVGDVIVVAGITSGAGDGGARKESAPEDVRGYDVRTGRLVWTFHVVPRPGEVGVDTWGKDSGYFSGDLGSWCCLSADEELGYVYVPLTAPTSAWYGGHRPGDNLFSNSLVAIDATTGQRVWHFQMVHHDLWEYDNVGPPILGDITVDGRRIKAVMQASKTAFLYVFDRVTGEPVWPIEERPVPQSTVPGEVTSPTQPFPTKPPPFDRQGVTEADLIDFTPESRARALELAQSFVLGPLFTPPSLISDAAGGTKGTLMAPGAWGAGNWNTGAFDPETGTYYAVSHTLLGAYGLRRPTDPDATMDYAVDFEASPSPALDGLPIVKPPYGRITAIDMNRGEELWMVPNGDGPTDHPLLAGLDLPPLGVAGRAALLVTKTLLFVGEGSEVVSGIARQGMWGTKFRAYEKETGEVLWETDLAAGVTGAPMTYMHAGRQYVVVAIGSLDHAAELVALALAP